MYLGRWEIDDVLTFVVNLHTVATGAVTDGDSAPTYRIYENETATPILTGTMALLDDANTVGFYSEQITLSAANGFEVGKSYNIRIEGIVAAVTGAATYTFQVEAAPATAAALAVVDGIVDDILVDTGTTLPALITSTNIGSGAISHTINIEVGGVDIAGADVWITSDVGGSTIVAGTLSTDAFGNATFMLDAGTYYVWVQKAGYNFTNPVTITVS